MGVRLCLGSLSGGLRPVRTVMGEGARGKGIVYSTVACATIEGKPRLGPQGKTGFSRVWCVFDCL